MKIKVNCFWCKVSIEVELSEEDAIRFRNNLMSYPPGGTCEECRAKGLDVDDVPF